MIQQEMLSFFNLSSLPFTKEIPTEKLCMLPHVEKALSLAQLLVETRGIGLIAGESGTGKSCILRLLAARLHKGLYKPVYICHTTCGLTEFYTHLISSFGLISKSRRASMFRVFKDAILSMNKTQTIHPVLIIDEADKLCNEILLEIRLLTNFEYDSLNAITILLCGQKQIFNRFALSILTPLATSITVTIPVDPLKREESFAYIEERVKETGNTHGLFTKNAKNLIHDASRGLLRSINTIATSSLLKAWTLKSPQVEKEHVQAVIDR
jgi:general secretion pathway protein A